MTVKYAYPRGKAIYYQRAIPEDLQAAYGAKRIKVKLSAKELVSAAVQVTELNAKVEAEWKALRSASTAVPKTIRERAVGLLAEFGLDPGKPDPNALSLFYDHLDTKRGRFAAGDEHTYRTASASNYLNPEESAAAQLMAKTIKPCLSDALNHYLKLHPNKTPKLEKDTRRNFETLIKARGDKPLDELTRADGHATVAHLLAQDLSTGSVRRMNNCYCAAVSFYFKEHDMRCANPFDSLPIPGEGKDAERRVPFTASALKTLAQLCIAQDDQPRWIVALLTDTGARLAEIVGLSLDDIMLDAEVPHIAIRPHPWRSLKTRESARQVPLVGLSLWASQRVKATATAGQFFAFPRYTNETRTNANNASATLSKWLKARGLDHTCHELRHTLADRLRDVQCPEDVRLAIGGWASAGVGNKYGTGYGLRLKAEWLGKIVNGGTNV